MYSDSMHSEHCQNKLGSVRIPVAYHGVASEGDHVSVDVVAPEPGADHPRAHERRDPPRDVHHHRARVVQDPVGAQDVGPADRRERTRGRPQDVGDDGVDDGSQEEAEEKNKTVPQKNVTEEKNKVLQKRTSTNNQARATDAKRHWLAFRSWVTFHLECAHLEKR